MADKFIKTSIPLWLAVILMVMVGGVVALISIYFREVIYEQNLFIGKDDGSVEKLEYGSWPALANENFFQSVKEEFIGNGSNFLEANLSDMKFRVYEKGVFAGEFDILSKGKEGSWWETPAGLYSVESKEKDHFSSFGRVYQPWSMAFQGNFFIHGWPYYPGGRPVESTYSGGCVRLSTEDAKKVYDLVEVGTPVLVFEEDFGSDGLKYKFKIPDLTATNYLAADLNSNFVFLKKSDGEEPVPIASITKLMTALVAIEYVNLEKEIVVTYEMIVPTSKPRLKVGQEASIFQLLYPLLMESSNEAAAALAQPLGEKYFINLMNKKAEALGMGKTHFIDAAGKNSENVSSVEDLFAFSKYLYNNRSFVLKMTAGDLDRTVYGSPIWKDLENFNFFAGLAEFIGGKVGLTYEARNTMLAVFEIDIGGEARPVAIIVLGSEDAAKDVKAVLEYIKTNYEPNNL